MVVNIPKINSCRCVAVDFDGTVYDRNTRDTYPGAVDALKWFRRWGYDIHIYSARASTPESIRWMRGWLREKGIVPDAISNVKPEKMTWLIDDRAIPFSNDWESIVEAVKKETFPWK